MSTGVPLASLVAVCDQDELVGLAISEGVAGLASKTLGQCLSPIQRASLRAEVRQETVRHLAYLDLLERFGAALEEADVAWVVLKGPVLTELAYGGVSRGYTDLDLLVPALRLRRAVQALEAVGAVLADRNWSRLIREAKGELSMSIYGSPMIDLHWHLLYLRSARQRFMLPTDEILERRQRVRLGAADAWALEPTDFAVHLALHASFDGAQRLRRLLDLERTLANRPPDWEVLVQRCHAWRVSFPVGVLLNRARETLGAAVPEEVIRELAGGPLERLVVRQLSGWVPYMPGRRSVFSGLTRSMRDGVLTTATEFADEAWRGLGEVLDPGLIEPTDPRHFLYESGGPLGFEHYVQMVENTDRYGRLSKRDLRRFALLTSTGRGQ
jgi:hypothetical protein